MQDSVIIAIITSVSSIATALFGFIAAKLKERNTAQQALLSNSYKRISELEQKLEVAWRKVAETNEQLTKVREETALYYQQRIAQIRDDLYRQLEIVEKRLSEWQEKYYILQNEYDSLQKQYNELEQRVVHLQRLVGSGGPAD